jgi:hypothetical protein
MPPPQNRLKKVFTALLTSPRSLTYSGPLSNALLQQTRHLNNSHMRHAECHLLADSDPH